MFVSVGTFITVFGNLLIMISSICHLCLCIMIYKCILSVKGLSIIIIITSVAANIHCSSSGSHQQESSRIDTGTAKGFQVVNIRSQIKMRRQGGSMHARVCTCRK